jgi:GDP-L-fucose synthase
MQNILITGKTGTVASNLNFGTGISSKDCDLRNTDQVEKLFNSIKPESVVHCAAKVGGLKMHMTQKYKLFYDNVMINTNVINCAKNNKVNRVLSFLSSCIFSEKSASPSDESMIHEHAPTEVHLPYGYAKRMLEIQSRICYEEAGLIYNCIIPTNIYGINDDFNMETGHVIGVLIHKAYLSYLKNEDFLVWGDGNQEREFLFTEDVAKITAWALDNYKEKEPLIISNNETVKIKDVAFLIAEKFGITNKIKFDTSAPSGQKKRSLNGNKLKEIYKNSFIPIEDGISKTVDWFVNNYPRIRL